jgi:hypothetical protein
MKTPARINRDRQLAPVLDFSVKVSANGAATVLMIWILRNDDGCVLMAKI